MNRAWESSKQIENEETARQYLAQRADHEAVDRLERLHDLLIEENTRQNLISRSSQSAIWVRHFADSAQLLRFVPRETLAGGGCWLDLGTGAGFPGLVIAVLRPDATVFLVEARPRRVEFLEKCVQALQLSRCSVLGERLERIEPFMAAVISARAFAPLEKLLRLSAPFSTTATRYLLPKGRSAEHELRGQKQSIRNKFHVEHSLTDRDAGIIVSA
ncbi:MAG: 16S rRNA (guanine(527)-N(7))-methyltransferase RsmG [Pseudomonadota bacterium]